MHSIRNRVRLLVGISLISLVILISFSFYFFQQQQTMTKAVKDAEEVRMKSENIRFAMTEVKNSRDAFFYDPSEENGQDMKHSIEEVIQMAGTYAKEYQSADNVSGLFQSIEKTASQYLEQVDPLVNMYSLIGFTDEEGMYQNVDKAYKSFVTYVQKAKDARLTEAFLMMKMAEEEYLEAGSTEEWEAFEVQAKNFQSVAEETSLSRQELDAINSQFLKYNQTLKSINNTKDQAEGLREEFISIASGVDSLVNQVSSDAVSIQEDLNKEQNETATNLRMALIIISVIAVALMLSSGVYLIRSIIRSIHSLQNGAEIIGNGNLTHRVSIQTRDEMATLAQTFNNMADKMQHSLLKVTDASSVLGQSSSHLTSVSRETSSQAEEVSAAIHQVAIGSQEQATQIEESTRLIAKVSDAIHQSEEKTEDISHSLRNADQEGKKGIETVHSLEESTQHFITLASHLTSQVKEANEHSKQINNIVGTIEEIADSTNLLALNASIEAARAGDAGRGFAVVAEEVRKLAERSKQEAKEIYALVRSMSEQMSTLSSEAENFNTYEIQQFHSVEQTKSAFERIVAQVTTMSSHIGDVNQSISHVSGYNQSLKDLLQDISVISEESVATAEEVAASSENQTSSITLVSKSAVELQLLAQELEEEVTQFILQEEETGDEAVQETISPSVMEEAAVSYDQNVLEDE
ncbi:methyl-accepting chemotaxis protein [Pontibacillus salicampi]|uniref:Methyl-accepting chemotaxis protein n=1 Tax=Pontibacillus salicampi TaxID=1449801 RepID=A0ABV6LIR5_9BACI